MLLPILSAGPENNAHGTTTTAAKAATMTVTPKSCCAGETQETRCTR